MWRKYWRSSRKLVQQEDNLTIWLKQIGLLQGYNRYYYLKAIILVISIDPPKPLFLLPANITAFTVCSKINACTCFNSSTLFFYQWFERILTLLLLVYMTREFMKIFRYGWLSYLSSLYNVWELVIIGLSLSAVCVYWRRNVAVQEALFEV